ncbi:MAG: hypothetical protein Q7U04_06945 [Bacteriovorax sp.]|jgi:hypothetical protein|nr:hypothetical protein [Bacteriovorax sp.]
MTKVFVQKQLKRIKLELQELVGILSLEELITNRRFTRRYEELHFSLARVI